MAQALRAKASGKIFIADGVLPVRARLNNFPEIFYKFRLAVAGQRHHFILIGRMQKA